MTTQQLTLGQLIEKVKAIPAGTKVLNLSMAHSHQCRYEEIAFEENAGLIDSDRLLRRLEMLVGEKLTCLRDSEYRISQSTKVWIAHWANEGLPLVDFVQDYPCAVLGQLEY